MPESLRRVISDDSGQGLAEYGMILSLIALICVAALTFMGQDVVQQLSTMGNDL